MDTSNFNAEIKTNIIEHLYVITRCPECEQKIGVSLGMVYRNEEGFCPKCLAPRSFYMEGDALESFAAAFDKLREKLQEADLTLALYNYPGVTTQ